MADPTTYNRFVLKFESPYARRDTSTQQWTVKFSMSGEEVTSQSDADATALDLAGPILALTEGGTSFVGYLYYAPGSDVNKYQASYATGVHPGTAAGYDSPSSCHATQLEVCGLAYAYVGVNSKGRAKYLFKHIHDILEQNTSPGNIGALTGSPLSIWSTGCGPNDLVTVDPTTGTASEAWDIHSALYTRQLRRGQKAPS